MKLSVGLAIAFVGLSALDAVLTLAGMKRGGVAELNPIMCPLLQQSEWLFWVFKIGMASIFALVLLIFSKRFPQQVKRIFIVLVTAMGGICLFNLIVATR